MKAKAAIFDLDGTLLNTAADIGTAINRVLTKYNLPTHELRHYNKLIGYGLEQTVYQAMPKANRQDHVLFQKCWYDAIDEYCKCLNQNTTAFAGINEVLDSLNAKNIPIAILSNKEHQFMAGVIKDYFAKTNFVIALGARPGYDPKPSPDSALEIAKLINIPTNEIAFIGDTEVDIKTAVAANMIPIGVTWGCRDGEFLKTYGAKEIVEKPSELLAFF